MKPYTFDGASLRIYMAINKKQSLFQSISSSYYYISERILVTVNKALNAIDRMRAGRNAVKLTDR